MATPLIKGEDISLDEASVADIVVAMGKTETPGGSKSENKFSMHDAAVSTSEIANQSTVKNSIGAVEMILPIEGLSVSGVELKGEKAVSLLIEELSVGVSNLPSSLENSCVAAGDTIKDSPAKTSTSKGFKASKDYCATMTSFPKPEIQSLPLDSLHCIASFLSPAEWCNGFGLVNKSVHTHCSEIVRRVRMHAFKCATEIVCAWKMGQWEDARELAALYIQAGVPIYSRCLGHSFHTVNWRIRVEATEILAKLNAETDGGEAQAGDSFFGSARTEFLAHEGVGRGMTYFEEKCLFWADRCSRVDARGGSYSTIRRRHAANEVDTLRRSASPPLSRSQTQQEVKAREFPVVIHQHLFDRHGLREYSVDHQDGRMTTPMVSLSADFFHPSTRIHREAQPAAEAPVPSLPIVAAVLEVSAWDPSLGEELPPPPPPAPPTDGSGDLAPLEPFTPVSVLSSVVVEVYSSTMTSSIDGLDGSPDVRQHLQSRFRTYRRRLEAFLSKGDTWGFEECILDFWDEFFPHTAGLHYHDLETAVPRLSCVQTFLMKPCPKAIGVVQCEIERIKITTKGKGVNVKGRLFPTYEYRLFIRNRHFSVVGDQPESAAAIVPDDFVRRDTVLMVAKNRGRKHTEPSGVIPVSATSKKGANNYYLYLPQQLDVDDHFNKCNEKLEKPGRLEPNGASHYPVLVSQDAGSVLLGRLQSNFIGTEFQIFTPQLRKLSHSKTDPGTSYPASVEDELDYDSGVSSDNPRRSRFSRFRRGGSSNPANSDTGSVNTSPPATRPKVKRALSSPEILQYQGRQPRSNRRAIANDAQPVVHSTLCEDEVGAITYTANLLGSRPRIMDVCIPKVSPEGVAAAEWRNYLDTCDDTDDCRMLSCFRQLQHRRENQDPQNPPAHDDNANQDVESEAGDETDFGLMALQNRPPWWNVELGSFVLNFGGRVSVASVKNFQLCERTNQDTIMLQFGRIKGRHSFTMDFQHPLTAVQAFSIAISSLQSKISFG